MRRGFATKRDAQRWANTVEVSKMTGEFIAPSLGRIAVGELACDWLARKKQACAPSHYRMLESAWRVHVQPRWGSVSVADVDVLGVEAWSADMGAKGAGATTVLRAHGVLSGILGAAVKAKRLAANPAKGIEGLPRKTAKRHVYLTADDIARLAAEPGEHRALVLVLAYTGIRWGEAIALQLCDVEFLRRRLSVSQNAVQLGVDHSAGPTKGRKARSVPVPTFVLDELSRQCQGKAPGELVFSGPGGGYLPRPKSAGGWFTAAVKRAGVQAITRSSAHMRLAGGVGRGQRAGAAADARTHQRSDDVGHLQRPIRRRPRRCGGHTAHGRTRRSVLFRRQRRGGEAHGRPNRMLHRDRSQSGDQYRPDGARTLRRWSCARAVLTGGRSKHKNTRSLT
jgi:integrase